MKITFFGAAGTVTGSKHLVTLADNRTILLDCGLFQGNYEESDQLNRHFGFDPSSIDFMILSHAHADHSGLIPRFVKQGFSGHIYCTEATYDLCVIMLADSAHIQESEAKFNKKKKVHELEDPLYTAEDVTEALKRFVKVPLNSRYEIASGIRLLLTDAGHILGSTAINLELEENGKTEKLFFSGDIGRYNTQLLRDPQPFPQADYLIVESTYGDRLHEETLDAEERLLKIVIETCVVNKGKLIIPAFSLGRTQELVYSFDKLNTAGRMPAIPVYVDSPLAISATEIIGKHPEWFNRSLKTYMQKDPNPFGYDQIVFIRDVAASKALNDLDGPCIIISASGMMEAGRIKHHLKNNLGDARNTVLVVGYLPENTLGERLLKGEPEVKIFGQPVKVLARIEKIDSYSAHGDYNEMLKYLTCQDTHQVKRVFLVHGEKNALLAWKLRLEKEGFSTIDIPVQGQSFQIN